MALQMWCSGMIGDGFEHVSTAENRRICLPLSDLTPPLPCLVSKQYRTQWCSHTNRPFVLTLLTVLSCVKWHTLYFAKYRTTVVLVVWPFTFTMLLAIHHNDAFKFLKTYIHKYLSYGRETARARRFLGGGSFLRLTFRLKGYVSRQ